MKFFLARLFNIFTVVATLSFFWGVIEMSSNGHTVEPSFLVFMASWFAVIAGLNYLVHGKPTLWNDKQD